MIPSEKVIDAATAGGQILDGTNRGYPSGVFSTIEILKSQLVFNQTLEKLNFSDMNQRFRGSGCRPYRGQGHHERCRVLLVLGLGAFGSVGLLGRKRAAGSRLGLEKKNSSTRWWSRVRTNPRFPNFFFNSIFDI